MGLFDKIKKVGSDFKKDNDIIAKVYRGEELTADELSFFNEKRPNTTPAEFKQKHDDELTLKKHKQHKIGGLKFFTDERGYYYFSFSKSLTGERYYLVGFEWSGPQYKVTSPTVTSGKDVQKGKKGSTLGGAAVGTLLAPGVGTLVGAAVGASGKKKTDVNRKSETTSTQEEIDTTAYLIFIEKDDKRVKRESIKCNTTIAKEVNSLRFTPEAVAMERPEQETVIEEIGIESEGNYEAEAVSSPIEEIKQYKELLDAGILTQEEFDAKKKKLLGI